MAVQLMEAGRASLLLRRNSEPVLTIAAAVGINPSEIPKIEVQIGRGIAGIVAEKAVTLLGQLADDTFVSAPIITREGVEGVLNLTERFGGRQFTGQDLASSSLIAGHIAHLLEYRRDSMVDSVTGLPNRRAFEEVLYRELARSARTPGSGFAVGFLDVDGLKRVNDEQGHDVGDELIRSVGEALQNTIRQYDFAARWGGDEFALLLAGAPGGETRIEQRISQRMASVTQANSRLIPGEYAISIGIARYPTDGTTAGELMKRADQRMYEYKRSRREPRG